MRSLKFSLPVSILTVLLLSGTAFAHSGGTDSSGCHTNHSTGDYHCHNGGTSGGGSTGGSTYTPSSTTTTSPSCPTGQHFSYDTNECTCPSGMDEGAGGSCSCKTGYAKATSGTYCFRLPSYAHEDSSDPDGWSCNEGYQKQGNSCTKVSASSAKSSTSVTEASAKVTSTVDGDTIKIQVGSETETIRIIGIDTPETVDPRKPVQCFGKEASAKMKELLAGKTVTLVKNPAEERDKYQRLLRYIELDGEDIGASMIRDGYAFSYKLFPHPRLEKYNELELEAKEAGRGLWGNCEQGSSTEQAFSDVAMSHPYSDAIRWGKSTNVLSGYADGSFKPDATVNRAEFLKIILEAKGVDVSSSTASTGFSDVDESAWFTPYVRYAKANGIIEGYADGTFKPEQPVNFAEALKMAYVALGVQGDDTATGEWYEKYLRHAQSHSVLFSNDANVGTGMSRKDVVWIVWKLEASQATASKSSTAATSSASSKQAVSYTFPLNLLENQQWSIEVGVTNDILKEDPIFTVTRNNDKFTVKAQKENSRTGELESYENYYQYQAGFEKRSVLDGALFFQVEECHYRYENIHEDYRCNAFVIPYSLTSGQVDGKQIHMSDYKQYVFSEGTYSVKILQKSGNNVTCNVKAETYVGEKIYYLPDSEFFESTQRFRCFENEQDATKAGYKKSHR